MSRGTTARDARSPHGYSPHGCRSEKSLRVSQCEETRIPGSSHGLLAGCPRTRSMSAMAIFQQLRNWFVRTRCQMGVDVWASHL